MHGKSRNGLETPRVLNFTYSRDLAEGCTSKVGFARAGCLSPHTLLWSFLSCTESRLAFVILVLRVMLDLQTNNLFPPPQIAKGRKVGIGQNNLTYLPTNIQALSFQHHPLRIFFSLSTLSILLGFKEAPSLLTMPNTISLPLECTGHHRYSWHTGFTPHFNIS